MLCTILQRTSNLYFFFLAAGFRFGAAFFLAAGFRFGAAFFFAAGFRFGAAFFFAGMIFFVMYISNERRRPIFFNFLHRSLVYIINQKKLQTKLFESFFVDNLKMFF